MDDVSTASAIQLSGSVSGQHTYSTILSDDKRTLIIKPDVPFTLGETVTVNLDDQLKTETGSSVGPLQFSFTISPTEVPSPAPTSREDVVAAPVAESGMGKILPYISKTSNTVPPTFPTITENVNNVQPKWNIFLTNMIFDNSITNIPYLMVLNTSMYPISYMALSSISFDFKWQPTGRMTYYDYSVEGWVVLDSSYQPIGTVLCGNGYSTDHHEIRMLPNGHAFVEANDVQQVDMDTVVPGGVDGAYVTGLIIQELDQSGNVVFQWRSWDHFAITDAIWVDLLAYNIDAVHGNAIEIDSDTSIVISSRHLSEITKIDRRTGDIIWRWGGKNNQFTFINDTIGFSYQHSIRKIANGHFALFDNGNYSTSFSRAAEYALDEKAKTATLVWSYRHTPDIASPAMGYVQRLDDGSTLICWGEANPTITLVDSNNSTLLEASFPQGVYSYRAYAYPSQTTTTGSSLETNLPISTTLFQNYPNPFNPTTQITYQLSEPGFVRLIVYDVLGREVAALVDDYQAAGNHSINFDASHLASGSYIYRLTSGANSISKKMLLLR